MTIKHHEFAQLYADAYREYIDTDPGRKHLAAYVSQREEARQNLETIVARRAKGDDITDAVLLKLLPYADTTPNRAAGAWVCITPAITGNVRHWFERAKWTARSDWPAIAEAILALLERCLENPADLADACEAFAALPYSKGFQSGMLSPILNALSPDAFRIMNNKSRVTYNYLAGADHGHALTEYARANATATQLCEKLKDVISSHALPIDTRPDDALDAFCHWLVAVRKLDFTPLKVLTQEQVDLLLGHVHRAFPDWTGFTDPRFIWHELQYKRNGAEKAAELLSETELKRLQKAGEYDEIISRVEQVGRASNLLFQSVPSSGDLNILYQEDLDRPAFCHAIVDLLYGAGSSEDRLKRYIDWVDSESLPNKWTFPTYLLFLSHPESEMFVKPYTTRWLFQTLGRGDVWDWKPNPTVYSDLKAISQDLLAALAPYGATDMIDVQSVMYTGYGYKEGEVVDGWEGLRRVSEGVDEDLEVEDQPDDHGSAPETRVNETSHTSTSLAEPFSRIFADRDEALWAFALMRQSLERLGVTGPDDERFRVSLREASQDGLRLRLVFGNVLAVGFRGPTTALRHVEFSLLRDRAADIDSQRIFDYRMPDGAAEISVYALPREQGSRVLSELKPDYLATLDVFRATHGHWKRASRLTEPQPEIQHALFDEALLDRLLSDGLTGQPAVLPGQVDGYFDEETFALLEDLQETPTREFYLEHKDAFVAHVESPLQALFADVVARLPEPMRAFMETEKNVFSRILKNDYGRGGAWTWYWGAMYKKGGRRIENAQLYLSIAPQELRFGVDIGDYDQHARQRYARNMVEHGAWLYAALESTLPEAVGALEFGRESQSVASVREWVSGTGGFPRIVQHLGPETVLGLDKAELADLISGFLETLFPIVLFTELDDPMSAALPYAGQEPPVNPVQPEYLLEACASATSLPIADLEAWVQAIERKGQAVLYGPPGTGKTFVARLLAQHLVGGGDGFWELVQFHPSYAYEDFVQGIRPQRAEGGGLDYPVLSGRFVRFCSAAALRTGRCVLIIDEINRANLARVFGELMYLLEYREDEVGLAVDGRRFRIPANVRILGTMNTADRSIALVDHALRRRFAFIRLDPQYDVLTTYHREHNPEFSPAGLVAVLRRLNALIADPHYAVGISFFLVKDVTAHLESIWRMEIEPYLEEYFFDNHDSASQFAWQRIKSEVLGQ